MNKLDKEYFLCKFENIIVKNNKKRCLLIPEQIILWR